MGGVGVCVCEGEVGRLCHHIENEQISKGTGELRQPGIQQNGGGMGEMRKVRLGEDG